MIQLWARAASIVAVFCLLAVFSTACGSDAETAEALKPAAVESAEEAAIQKYHWYLEHKATSLVDWTTQLWGQIVAGEAGKAESRYATAQVQLGQLEPAAQLFPSLELRIHGLAPPQQGGELVGFHRIEKPLFTQESTRGLKPVAKSLVADVGRLHYNLKAAELQPVQIATGAKEVLDEVSTTKIAGKAEPYSHIDMVDIAANVEGAEAAFEAIRPLLASEDLKLVQEIEAQFVKVYEALQPTGQAAREPQTREPAAGARFILYPEIGKAEVDKAWEQVKGTQ
jgi:iron uptake system component EfeO